MKQVVLDRPESLTFGEAVQPRGAGPGEAVVKVRRVGICGTDLHAYRGKQPFFTYPRRLGHELGVEIVEAGENAEGLKAGDCCAVEPYMTCGRCIACRNGKSNCCMELKCLGVHVDGGMCESMILPTAKLHPSEKLTLDQLALVETLGIGCHAVNRAQVKPGEWILVVGAGPIGLATAQFAKANGGQVIVMDINEQRLNFCREHLGIECYINGKLPVLEQLEQYCDKEFAPAVFDCTGNVDSMQQAFQYVSHGGRVIYVGLVQADVSFNDPHFHRREVTLMSSRNSTGKELQEIIRMIEAGKIDTTPWITHRCDFEEVAKEFPKWLRPETGCIKAMVELK